MDKKDLAKLIDHTLLKSDTKIEDIKKLCEEAMEYQFYSVCINPCYVKKAKEFLKNSDVKVCTVISFPLGASTIKIKIDEATEAIENSADEIDMVMNIGIFKSNKYDYIYEEISSVKKAIGNKILKVIIETSILNEEEKIKASDIVKQSGADFVKTSTGFSQGGATKEDILLIRKTVGANFGIKASGGIKSYEQAIELINAGATRIGSSSSVKIMKE
ncbi:MAG TPA: deoxyribose-phosphate aldolase [Caldisericia bacterium]|nr:deoxyribose-phosphate aldolase [Caldisericia bacterium]HOL82952.1 deoxyribose-phosphate aldolase [Caldisericia bacterium]HON83371.1 deoxyribose-phosphate aldolase [Caldisericia bacterium]HPC56536.1 deoxyribose-phosphate aldolase [Caldisericia bacterium]HPP42982.1 deoxyribose-phosphate aldolase [Caldisericia bacterium]